MVTTASMLMDNHETFLNTDLSQYEGQWIAIVDKLIVATGASVKEVFEKARKDYPDKRPLIARAPTKRLLILAAGKK